MRWLWWAMCFPVRVLLGLLVGAAVFLVGLLSHSAQDDGDAERGRERLQGRNYPGAWVPRRAR